MTQPGSCITFSDPAQVMNFVEMARGMGVEASMATTASEFHAQVTEAMAFDGPRLIHMCVTGSGHLE